MKTIKKILKWTAIVISCLFVLFVASVIKVGRETSAKLEEQYNTGHYDHITAYDESNSRTYGYGGDERSIDFETFYGIKLNTHEDQVTCTPYSNIDGITLQSITLNSINSSWTERAIKNLTDEGLNNTFTFSTLDLYNGKFDAIYTVSAKFHDDTDNKDHVVTGYLHIKNSVPMCCRVDDLSQRMSDAEQTAYHEIIDTLNPADYLDDSRLCYPISYSGKTNFRHASYSCVANFQTLSDQIVDNTWSDELKVYAFVRYITDNYAYDAYMVEELDNKPRAAVANDIDNPTYWLYTSHVGMCQDFANALVIMCRHHNIPCTTLADREHVVPVAYINDEWVAIDVNPLLPKCVEEDVDPNKWVQEEQYRWDRNYGLTTSHMNQIEMCIDYIP